MALYSYGRFVVENGCMEPLAVRVESGADVAEWQSIRATERLMVGLPGAAATAVHSTASAVLGASVRFRCRVGNSEHETSAGTRPHACLRAGSMRMSG